MKNFFLINLILNLISKTFCNNVYIPEITIANQREIYERYCEVIKKQENNEHSLYDSMIDISKKPKVEDGDKTVLVVDLGGSSLKISLLKYYLNKEENKFNFEVIKNKKYILSEVNKIEQLSKYLWHEWIALKINEFIIDKELKGISMPKTAGLSFSFSIRPISLSSAIFMGYHKDWWFSTEGLKGHDIVEDLNQSLRDKGIDIKINCVLNDVIATYMSGVSKGLHNFMGLIIGTGTNAGYLINDKMKGEKRLINSEWACFEIEDLIEIDECTKKSFMNKELNKPYMKLEILTAGLKLEEIIKNHLRNLEMFEENDIEVLSIKNLYLIHKLRLENNEKDMGILTSHALKILEEVRIRAYKLLVPMILAVFKDEEEFSLVTNGTILGMEYDQGLLEKEIKEFMTSQKLDTKRFKGISFVEDGSLLGLAYTSILHDQE